MRTGHNQSQSVFQFFSPSPLCCVREVFAIKFPWILVSNHTPSPRLCMSMHSGSTSFVSTSAITAVLPPSFVHVNALGVDFPRVRVGNHSRAPPPSPPISGSLAHSPAPLSTITAIPRACAAVAPPLLHPLPSSCPVPFVIIVVD